MANGTRAARAWSAGSASRDGSWNSSKFMACSPAAARRAHRSVSDERCRRAPRARCGCLQVVYVPFRRGVVGLACPVSPEQPDRFHGVGPRRLCLAVLAVASRGLQHAHAVAIGHATSIDGFTRWETRGLTAHCTWADSARLSASLSRSSCGSESSSSASAWSRLGRALSSASRAAAARSSQARLVLGACRSARRARLQCDHRASRRRCRAARAARSRPVPAAAPELRESVNVYRPAATRSARRLRRRACWGF